jgi:hypothetical protein
MDFIKALFGYLKPPAINPEYEIAGKDNGQEPRGKHGQVNDRAPPQKGLKIFLVRFMVWLTLLFTNTV